jgi:DNA-directed RNA polymerase specialized sigma24 family protein
MPEPVASRAPSEAAERVAWVLAELPEEYAHVLRAKYEENQPVAEIAKSCGRSAKAVESLLSRARVAFRKSWAGLDFDSAPNRGHQNEGT